MAGKCAAYWRAKKLGKECGVPESHKSLRKQERYEEFIEELVDLGVNKDLAFDYIPYTLLLTPKTGKLRNNIVSFLSLRRNSPIRQKMVDYIFLSVMQGKKITGEGLFKASKTNKLKWTDEDFKIHYTDSAATSAITGKKLVKRGRQIAINLIKENPYPDAPTIDGKYSITQKIVSLSSVCTSGQFGILQDICSSGYCEEEYSAFCLALKWALERLEQEKMNKDSRDNPAITH